MQALDAVAGNSSMECLSLFRQLMLDVVVTTSYGYRLGAVRKYTSQLEDPLAVAVNDFPKRGLLVSYHAPANPHRLTLRIEKRGSVLGLETHLQNPQRAMAETLRLGQDHG